MNIDVDRCHNCGAGDLRVSWGPPGTGVSVPAPAPGTKAVPRPARCLFPGPVTGHATAGEKPPSQPPDPQLLTCE